MFISYGHTSIFRIEARCVLGNVQNVYMIGLLAARLHGLLTVCLASWTDCSSERLKYTIGEKDSTLGNFWWILLYGSVLPYKAHTIVISMADEKIVHLKWLGRKMKFLKQITKPVIQTLDILQRGKNVFCGMVMSSLFLLQKKLQSLSEMK